MVWQIQESTLQLYLYTLFTKLLIFLLKFEDSDELIIIADVGLVFSPHFGQYSLFMSILSLMATTR
jgi:hypothetical protein